MADISRDTFDRTKHFTKVILQQGVPWLDADFNEAQDIETNFREVLLKYSAGTGTPDNGFQILENSVAHGGTGDLNNKFLISTGYFFVDGWIGQIESTQEYNTQLDWAGWDGAGEPAPTVPFLGSPPVLSPPGSGTRVDKVVLCLWHNEIDSVEDSSIIDPTLLVETCRRLRMMAFIYVTSTPIPADTPTHKFIQLASINRSVGKDSIEDGDITDMRVDLRTRLAELDEIKDEVIAARTSAVYGTQANLTTRIQQVEDEVDFARGTQVALDTRLDIALENDGKLKLNAKEAGTSKEINTQIIDFIHGLDVTPLGGQAVQVDVDEDELDFDFVRFSAVGSDPAAEAGKFKLYSKTVSGTTEIFARDSDGSIQQWTSKGHFIGGLAKEVKMWWGLLIEMPVGWQLCDGSAGKPNLLDKFIKGIATGITNPGVTGGTHDVTLIVGNLPSHTHAGTYTGTSGNQSADHTHTGTSATESVGHTHSGTTSSDGAHAGHYVPTIPHGSGSTPYISPTGTCSYADATVGVTGVGGHTHTLTTGGVSASHTHTLTTGGVSVNHTHSLSVTGTSGSTGSGTSFDNRPAFYELAYITKI